ncbi:MAG: beta-L-arabinofuranosidase domain-containing protein [Planctomycetota bacterium]
MPRPVTRRLDPVPFTNVKIDDAFWTPRIDVNRRATIPIEYEQCKKTGRIDAFKLDWKPGQPNPPHIFWDSDVAKWIEAGAYSLAIHPDAKLERLLDDVIGMIANAQQPDGYLNVHFIIVEPEKRWTNLRDWHELYSAGHLIEAAVAYCEATGKRKFLDVMRRYADHIDSVFGPEEGKKRGYCGHEEIELALVKLYRATGEERYLKLSKFFIDERGRQPHYYDIEAKARGQDPGQWHHGKYDYNQSHIPVREQKTAEGHSVRAMYLYCGMADIAAETGDKALLDACKAIWRNVTERRMYVTGGIGSTKTGERFTVDYDLPNETAYAETCAAIGLVFWAHRMLQIEADAQYADVMERALYNGAISGVSLDGKTFFYVNPMESRGGHHRQEWFGCACCPPNIARLIASLGQYVYSQSEKEAYVHLFVQGSAKLNIGGRPVTLVQKTGYPWSGKVRIDVHPEKPTDFTLAVRIPGWCRDVKIEVSGEEMKAKPVAQRGYVRIRRKWRKGDRVELTMAMPVERIEAHPDVRSNLGRVTLQRGPIVYCLEQADNGPNLNDIILPHTARLAATFEENLLGGVTVITGKALRRDRSAWKKMLYRSASSKSKTISIKATPYCTWDNRKPGEMLVWIREE